jgi:hypothetical protein
MSKSPLKSWLCSVASEFVEGIADGFIIVAGGAQAAQVATANVRALTPQELVGSILIAGVWYVAAFVKKNPPPFGQDAAPVPDRFGSVSITPASTQNQDTK